MSINTSPFVNILIELLCPRPIELPHTARKIINQSQRLKDNSLNASSYVENLSSNWEKCNGLNQRSTKITTNEEYSNFDFQVCSFIFSQNAEGYNNNLLFSRNGWRQKSIGTNRLKLDLKKLKKMTVDRRWR